MSRDAASGSGIKWKCVQLQTQAGRSGVQGGWRPRPWSWPAWRLVPHLPWTVWWARRQNCDRRWPARQTATPSRCRTTSPTAGGGGNLPDVHSDVTISGGGHTLSGGGDHRGLFVASGTVRVENLAISDALAQSGTSQGGGAGAGLGGALFVNEGEPLPSAMSTFPATRPGAAQACLGMVAMTGEVRAALAAHPMVAPAGRCRQGSS